jgi:uncharacterized membrane protein YphA (DoxX/SURF4 family)
MTANDLRTEPDTRLALVSRQSYLLLRLGFTVLPIVVGIDKFTNLLVDWPKYLAPWLVGIAPFGPSAIMHVVGVVEIVAGLVVAVKPRYGAWLVAAWLGGIVVTLVTSPGWFDVALRDVGLLLAAVTLARLASVYDPPGLAPRRRSR